MTQSKCYEVGVKIIMQKTTVVICPDCVQYTVVCICISRIVKMSSPNLNMLTLLGSVLTYSSGFLFAIEDRSPGRAAGSKVVMQVRFFSRHFVLHTVVVEP